MVAYQSPKLFVRVRVLPPVHGSLVKWIITQRYGRWVKGSNPLGATQVRDGVRLLIKPLCND